MEVVEERIPFGITDPPNQNKPHTRPGALIGVGDIVIINEEDSGSLDE